MAITEKDQGLRRKKQRNQKILVKEIAECKGKKIQMSCIEFCSSCYLCAWHTALELALPTQKQKAIAGETERENTVNSLLFRWYFLIQKNYIRTQELDYRQVLKVRGDFFHPLLPVLSILGTFIQITMPIKPKFLLLRHC